LKFFIFLNTNNAVLLHLQFWKINWTSKSPHPFCSGYLGLYHLPVLPAFLQGHRGGVKGTEDTQKVSWHEFWVMPWVPQILIHGTHSTFVSQASCFLNQVWYLGGLNIQRKLNIFIANYFPLALSHVLVFSSSHCNVDNKMGMTVPFWPPAVNPSLHPVL
jgi:hypothetical protein